MKPNQYQMNRMAFTSSLKMAGVLALALAVLAALAFLPGQPMGTAQADSLIWRDEFDSEALDPAWFWVNENSDRWNLTEQPGFLRIYASPYGTGGENLLLRPISEADFTIETRLLFEPDTNFQFAGLVIYQDQANFLQFGRAFCDVPDVCVGNGIYFDYVAGSDGVNGNFATPVDTSSEAFLRLEKRGAMVKAFYSGDGGISWYEFGTHWLSSEFQASAVGLTAAQDLNTPEWDIPADFDFFELSEGGGFLPEGFHDYDQGDVPNWACNAGGWAVDPDDRAAHINVEIVVDHQTVALLVAEEFRQDLLDAGVCEGGNCGFATSLWDAISSYEAHTVAAWAQDQSGEWVLLSSSPKALTCRSYDIYTYDTLTGETRQVSMFGEAWEFNPRWSPDGSQIVHDRWDLDFSSHDVQITEVETGLSAPLAGAEGGSYPSWSPNGRWIAFDRGADGDYRVFIVPPSGGEPTLVREDAFMASWAPNSQRLAFHQDSDGSIRTTDLTGNQETLVVQEGNGPAWSPNGRWIAYEVGGDLWKVAVDLNGNPRGEPIQLTSEEVWEGRPSWSADSQTIVYFAGFDRDTDIWTIPAEGGPATRLTGGPDFADYDPNYSNNGRFVAYSSYTPLPGPVPQAARLWVAAYTYDLPAGSWSEDFHPYHFEFEWSAPEPGSWAGQGGELFVSAEAPLYEGAVLLRGPMELGRVVSRGGPSCEEVEAVHPDQPTRFLVGWLPDFGEMTYPQARAHFESLTARVVWDDGPSAELVAHEIRPFSFDEIDKWFDYVCGYAARE